MIHAIIILLNIVSFFILPFLTPWYVYFPLCTVLARTSFSKMVKCPMTIIENKIRRKLGKQEIKGFVHHYIWKYL